LALSFMLRAGGKIYITDRGIFQSLRVCLWSCPCGPMNKDTAIDEYRKPE